MSCPCGCMERVITHPHEGLCDVANLLLDALPFVLEDDESPAGEEMAVDR